MSRFSKIIGPVVLIICFMIMFALSLPYERRDGLFPQGVIIALLALCVMLTVSEAREKGKDDTTHDQAGSGWYRIWGAILLTIAYIFVCNWVGYWAATFVFLFTLLLILGERSWIILTVLPVVSTLMIYAVFYRFLHIPLPTGTLF